MVRKKLGFSKTLKSYKNDAAEAAFLLGGIGTGNFSIGARGEMRDWEIFNAPNKGTILPYTFFAIRAKEEGREAISKILEAKLNPPFNAATGIESTLVAGLPRFRSSVMEGEYPFVRVTLHDPALKLELALEAFTPLIPLDADDSGIPGAILRYQVKNLSDRPTEVTIAGSLVNAAAFNGINEWHRLETAGEVVNEYREDAFQKGIFFRTREAIGDNLKFGDLSLSTSSPNVTSKVNWLESGWYDGIQDFWKDFTEDGLLERESKTEAKGSVISIKTCKVGSLGIHETLAPGEEKTFEFVLAWYFPNRANGWSHESVAAGRVGNYYGTLFGSSWDAASFLNRNMERLEGETAKFHDALFGSTYPQGVLDAISSGITVLRSNTCFRTGDGTFYGWEGCHDKEGSCHGSCTHVWNYAQTLAFLFPELERSMRRVEFGVETDDEGRMAFRTQQTFGLKKWDMLPAADGQPGTVIRLYRDWKLSGDGAIVRELWTKVAASLDFAFSYWDKDGDCVPDDRQHNTYDIEFYGPNPLTGILFCAALKAGAEMAAFVGDAAHEAKFRTSAEKAAATLDSLLWNGEYYQQSFEDIDRYRYQFGTGCLSDQLLGQLLAHVSGLGYLLPREHVRTAISSVFRFNYREDFTNHENVQRTYVLNDEKGLVLCTWPRGGRPRIPFIYSDEAWTGIEYQVAAHLIYEGLVDEGLKIVDSVRERFDGYRRNPWDEIECGHHYARSMASWSVMLALSGFRYDMTKGKVSFAPRMGDKEFSTFWSTGTAWGVYRRRKNPGTGKITEELEVLHGEKDGISLGL